MLIYETQRLAQEALQREKEHPPTRTIHGTVFSFPLGTPEDILNCPNLQEKVFFSYQDTIRGAQKCQGERVSFPLTPSQGHIDCGACILIEKPPDTKPIVYIRHCEKAACFRQKEVEALGLPDATQSPKSFSTPGVENV